MDKQERVSLIQSPLEEVLPNAMLPYAEHVIMDRALPRVEDGLKPVQRRILYTMHELGLTPDKPHKKCARIVGDCMGKYHPHGDRSVYDAMVRMAQDFNMRMTLVNGHGNFGSVDGDPAAAMRYTEAKMDELALELLRDLDKDTVNFNLNFDDSLKEPDTLPGRYPNLLVNGSSGIAVGLATNIPPHNLAEVIDGVAAYIDNPKIDLKSMMKIIKGPDFPTGGYIIADELEQAYETGRGKITMRAKINVESEGEKKVIVITELPYQVNKATLLKKIADVREEKKDVLAGISEILDESDRNGMRAVVKLKKDADPDKIIEILLKCSDLECTFGINMVAIAGGKPKQMGLLEIIAYYVAYQRDIIYKRTRFELNQAKDRCHILEGLIIAVKNIDEVIKIIKAAQSVADARAKLRTRFDLSERQAQAILDLRLARLTKMEIEKLKEELKELKELIKNLQAIIDSKKLQLQLVKDEMLLIKKQYKDARRSQIFKGGEVIKVEKSDEMKEACPCYFISSATGTVKKVGDKNYNSSRRSISERSTASELAKFKLFTRSDSEVLLFTNYGNCIKTNMLNIPEHRLKDRGTPLKSVCADVKSDERVVFAAENNLTFAGNLIFITKEGMIKKSECPECVVSKSFYQVAKLKDGDEIINIGFDTGETTIFFVTKNGMCLNALKDDIPLQGRVAGGVKGINLSDGDYVLYASQIDNEGEIIIAHENGMAKRVISCLIDPMARYRKGVKIADITKSGLLFAGYVKEPYELAYVNKDDEMKVISTEDISIESRTSKPKPIKGVSDKLMKAMYTLN